MRKYLHSNGKDCHVEVAERALGHPLPKGAEVHHVDRNRHNNDPHNLVICPSTAYHRLLHIRADALDACGHADWRKCKYCKQYDAPENLRNTGEGNAGACYHAACFAAYKRVYRANGGKS